MLVSRDDKNQRTKLSFSLRNRLVTKSVQLQSQQKPNSTGKQSCCIALAKSGLFQILTVHIDITLYNFSIIIVTGQQKVDS